MFEQDHVAQQDALLDDRVVVIAGKKVVDAACGAEAALRVEAECRGRFARADPQRAVALLSIAADDECDHSPAVALPLAASLQASPGVIEFWLPAQAKPN